MRIMSNIPALQSYDAIAATNGVLSAAAKPPAAVLDAAAALSGEDKAGAAAKTAERLSNMSRRKLKFEYVEDADVFQITVVRDGDRDDDEVVRKIPADSILRVIENIDRMRGFSVDMKA